MKESLKIAIAGATGYVGLELIKILSKHPNKSEKMRETIPYILTIQHTVLSNAEICGGWVE